MTFRCAISHSGPWASSHRPAMSETKALAPLPRSPKLHPIVFDSPCNLSKQLCYKISLHSLVLNHLQTQTFVFDTSHSFLGSNYVPSTLFFGFCRSDCLDRPVCFCGPCRTQTRHSVLY